MIQITARFQHQKLLIGFSFFLKIAVDDQPLLSKSLSLHSIPRHRAANCEESTISPDRCRESQESF